MNIWKVLGIEATADKKAIKKAYHARLRNTHPEDDPEAFMKLREAYEEALKAGVSEAYYHEADIQDIDDYDGYDEGSEEDESLVYMDEKEQAILEWWRKVEELYGDYEKRMDVENWKPLLYEDIPYRMEFYERCRWQIYNTFIHFNFYSLYLVKDVRMLIDSFFSYSRTPLERTRMEQAENFRKTNKRLKLCENIEFDKVIANKASAYHIDEFLRQYENFLTVLTGSRTGKGSLEGKIKALKSLQVFYLPFECIHTALHFQKYSEEQVEKRIRELEESCGDAVEVKLLKVQYNIYKGNTDTAKWQLMELYREVPVKNYAVVYQMAECCKRVSMYYEAYMLVKMLTWLNPKPFMHDMAEEIYASMEDIYIGKKKEGVEIPDIEHIRMCRMYLRSNREEDALKALKEVKDTKKHLWEYEMAHCLCIFYEEAKKEDCNLYLVYEGIKPGPVMEIEPAVPVLERLLDFPKEHLNDMERLEWEELLTRYLFEQRKYGECVSRCNELLEEYPLSYPILLLRSYADYGRYSLGPQHSMKDYGDLNFLIAALPNRTEARLLSANAMMFCHKLSRAKNIVEPVKDKVPDHFAYYCFKECMKEAPGKYKKGVMELFRKAKNAKVDIPPVSKYRLLDLHNIFVEACEFGDLHIDDKDEKNSFFSILDELIGQTYNQPEKYVDLHWLYYRSLREEKALEVALRQLETAKTSMEKETIYFHLWEIYRYMGNLEEAEKYIKLITKEKINYVYANMGCRYYDMGNVEKAIEYITNAMSDNAVNEREYAVLGKAYAALGEKEKAVEAFIDGIKICNKSGDYGRNKNLYYDLYDFYIKNSEWNKAIEALEKMKEHTKSEYRQNDFYYQLGYVYWRRSVYAGDMSEKDKVIALWTKAIDKGIKFGDMYGRLARLYSKLGQTEKAVEVIWKGIETGDASGDYLSNENLYYDLYYIYSEAEEWDKAIEALEKMKENTKSEYWKNDYYYQLGFVYWRRSVYVGDMAEKDKVIDLWTKAIDKGVKGSDMYGRLARLYSKLGQTEKAVELIWEGIENNDASGDYLSNENLYLDLYYIYEDATQWDKAIEALEKMKENTKSEYLKNDYYYRLGFVYWRCSVYVGDMSGKDKVIDLWTKAIDKDIKFGDMYGRLAWIYKDLGQAEKAIDVLWKGIEKCDNSGDYLTDGNLYHDLYLTYLNKEMWEDAVNAAKLMGEHTKLDIIKADYPCYLAYASIHAGDYETAYRNFAIVKKNPQYSHCDLNIDINILLSCYGMESYEEASTMALELAYSSDEVNDGLLMLAFHSSFMLENKADTELAKRIIKEIEKLITQSEDNKEDKCEYLLDIVELYAALGKTELAESCKKQAMELLSEIEDDCSDDIASMNGWCCAYRNEFKKAAWYYENTPKLLQTGSDSIISYQYFVKMSKKESGEME